MPPLGDVSKGRILGSWKEIAARLGVTVRTVQRWEKTAGLPIHRRGVGRIGRVYAHADELDRWIAAGLPEPEAVELPRRRWRPYAFLLPAVLLLIVAGVEVWSSLVPKLRVPAEASVQGARLIVVDSRGRACWERLFPHLSAQFEAQVHDKALVADIDDDRRPEVLFNYTPEEIGGADSALLCFDRHGRLRWEHRYGVAKTFAGRYFEPTYIGRFIRRIRIGGRPYLLAVANHYIWYPGQIAVLDPRTGRPVEEYWHPGAIDECSIADLDGDGDGEAVFGAINNPGQGIGHAAVGVLKFPMSRFATHAVDSRFPPVTGGGESRYILLPTPDVSEALSVLPKVFELRIDPQRIFVRTSLADVGAVVYYLDHRLELLEQRFSDQFAAVHQRLFIQHLLDHQLTSQERDALARVVSFPYAPDGNDPALKDFWKY